MIVGIDPGKTGAIAWCLPEWSPGEACVLSMPEFESQITQQLDALNTQAKETPKCFIEKQAYMKGDGGQGIATYMRHYGYLLGSMRMLGWQIDIVDPKKWKKQQSVLPAKKPVPRNSTAEFIAKRNREHKKKLKDASIDRAMSLYPTIDYGTNRAKHIEGRAEALLILQYGRELTIAAANVPTPQWEIDDAMR